MDKIGLTFSVLLIFSSFSFAQLTTSPGEVRDLKELVKKEDFENVSKFLKAKGFTISKFDLNYNHGSYYVICEIQCEKKLPILRSREGNFFDIEPAEELNIEFYEREDDKELTISQNYLANFNDFKSYYYTWKMDMNWTYIILGNPNQAKYSRLLGGPIEPDPRKFGYEIGDAGTWGSLAKNLKKVSTDSLDLRPSYKELHFRNYNPVVGPLRDYHCQMTSPWTKDKYYLLADTIYSFRLKMKDYFPKFVENKNKSAAKFQTISLLKSGKTYFIYITIGNKKRKYVLDSGASDVTIDESSYKQLVESGSINFKHKMADAKYQIADGSMKTYKRTLIPEFLVGDIVIENIVATIVPDGQPLLLGKSFLDNFKTWKIDNSKSELIVEIK